MLSENDKDKIDRIKNDHRSCHCEDAFGQCDVPELIAIIDKLLAENAKKPYDRAHFESLVQKYEASIRINATLLADNSKFRDEAEDLRIKLSFHEPVAAEDSEEL